MTALAITLAAASVAVAAIVGVLRARAARRQEIRACIVAPMDPEVCMEAARRRRVEIEAERVYQAWRNRERTRTTIAWEPKPEPMNLPDLMPNITAD